MSKINYLSYRVIPLIQNGNTPALYRVEPVSAISTNVGYNSNRPKTDEYFANNSNNKDSSFEDILKEKMVKQNGLGRKK